VPAIPNSWINHLCCLEANGAPRGAANLLRRLSLCSLTLGGGTATAAWVDRQPVRLDLERQAPAMIRCHRTTLTRNLDLWFDYWTVAPDGSGWVPFLPAWPECPPGAWWHPFNSASVDDMMGWSGPALQLALSLVGPLRASARFKRPYVTTSLRRLARDTGRSTRTIQAGLAELASIGQIERGPRAGSITLLSACPLSQISASGGLRKSTSPQCKSTAIDVQKYRESEHPDLALNIVIEESSRVPLDATAEVAEVGTSIERDLEAYLAGS